MYIDIIHKNYSFFLYILANIFYSITCKTKTLENKGEIHMYTTTEIMREMLESGMISKEEYAEAVCEYRNHVNALMTMDSAAKKAKEKIERIKAEKRIEKEETDPKYKKLCEAYLNGHLSEEDFRRLAMPYERKRTKKRIDDRMKNDGYMVGRLKFQ